MAGRRADRLGRCAFCAAGMGILIIVVSGCGLANLFQDDGNGDAWLLPASGDALTPIALALRYLEHTQLDADQSGRTRTDYAGDWPQWFAIDRDGPFVRDASPFMPTFIHHALTRVREEYRQILQLTAGDMERAADMRKAAVTLMLRFQADPESPDAGTFGFWPLGRRGWLPGDLILSLFIDSHWQTSRFMGVRFPVNVSFYPAAHAIPSDADDTAAIYAALLDHAVLDGGPDVTVRFERFFSDWRDLGQVPQRNEASWLKPDSGAYLTWLAYLDDPNRPQPNDVDIVVNANVLYALGRYGRLDTPGVSEAIAVINDAVLADAYRSDPEHISLYYPDNFALHYCVTRAYYEGGVLGLAPAVERLTDDLLAWVRVNEAGQYFWDNGDPHLNTAFATLSLLFAGHAGPITQGAVDYLVSEQDPKTGAWDAGSFFLGHLDGGKDVIWVSPALTTAIALEALAEHEILTSGGPQGKAIGK